MIIYKINNSIKVIASSMHGEWWIDNGSAIFADGDFGDLNHEMYVANIATNKVLSEFGIYADGYGLGDYEENIIEIMIENENFRRKVINKKINNEGEDKYAARQIIKLDPASYIIKYLKDNSSLNDVSDLVFIAYNSSSSDTRLFAMKKWGWKRVAGNSIETWTFGENDFKSIQRGLSDILEYDDDLSAQTVFLEIRSSNKYISNFPLEILADGTYSQAINFIKKNIRRVAKKTGYHVDPNKKWLSMPISNQYSSKSNSKYEDLIDASHNISYDKKREIEEDSWLVPENMREYYIIKSYPKSSYYVVYPSFSHEIANKKAAILQAVRLQKENRDVYVYKVTEKDGKDINWDMIYPKI